MSAADRLTDEASIVSLLDRIWEEHRPSGGGFRTCRCGVVLTIEHDDEGQPLYNPYTRHQHERMAAALAARGVRAPGDTTADRDLLAEAAEALRQAGRDGYLLLDDERVPWEAVARWLDARSAALAAADAGRVSARDLAEGDAVRAQGERLIVERVVNEGDGGVFVWFVDFNQGRPLHFLHDVEFDRALAARPAPDTLAAHVLALADEWDALPPTNFDFINRDRRRISADLRALVAGRSDASPEGGHDFLPVAGHPDDDECTHRADGTNATYCGRRKDEHDA